MKSILVIGMGKFGKHLATKMQELGNEVMVIDKNIDVIEKISSEFTDAHICDCTNEDVLKSLGVDSFDICFVTMGKDFQASIVITSLLKKNGAKEIVAKANQRIQADLLKQVGASEVVNPEREFAEKLSVRYNANNIYDYVPLTSEFSMYEIPVPKKWIGKSITEINVRKKYNINIIAVKNDNALQTLPGAEYVFKENEHICIIGKSSDVFKLSAIN